jgi:glycosyltransferase involved in cell wall biosynthesis
MILKMKVCMLAEKFPPEFTGSGKQAVSLACALSQKNVQVIAICSRPLEKSSIDYSERFPIIRLRSSRRTRLRSFQFAMKSMIWLWRNRNKYDILHAHGYCWAAITALLVSKLLGKKTLYKITLPGEDDPSAIYNSRFGRIKSMFINKFDAFVAISNLVFKCTKGFERAINNIFTIPNGVDQKFSFNNAANIEARKSLIKGFRLDQDARIISYVGSIERRKGIDVLARSWHRICSEIPESRLFLVGPYFEGTEFYKWLVEFIREYLGTKVFLIGKVANPELYYRASDVFVFPSRNEGLPNALLEAMACGTACVATRIEGITDDILLNSYNGLLVDQEDNEALADSVVSILRNPELKKYLAMNAVKTVDEKFRIDMIAEKYHEMYKYLLNGN